MASSGTTESINDQAAQWAVREAYEELAPESRAELEAWLVADRRHYGAYIRAHAGLHAIESTVTSAARARADDALGTASDGRRWFGWVRPVGAAGAALALSAALVLLVVPRTDRAPPSDSAANRILNLADGSVATLDRGAQIQFLSANGARNVILLSGRATFHVAKDKAHPFVVRSGEVYAQATGTVYSVARSGPRGGTVGVTEGSVLVWRRDERDQAVLLHAGETLTLAPLPERATAPAFAPARLPPPDLAQISLDNTPIAAAAARFNRINSTKIIVTDPAIGETPVIGLFRADDPEQFAQAAAAITGGTVERSRGRIVITKK